MFRDVAAVAEDAVAEQDESSQRETGTAATGDGEVGAPHQLVCGTNTYVLHTCRALSVVRRGEQGQPAVYGSGVIQTCTYVNAQ